MSTARLIVGSAIHELQAMPAGSVDLIVTSSPFLAVRDYLPPDHPMKPYELGVGGSPVEFVGELLDVVEACAHVLSPYGSLAWELGDSMAESGGAGGDYYNADGQRAGQPKPAGAAKARREGAGREGPNTGRRPGAVPTTRKSSPRYRGGSQRWDKRSGILRADDTETYTIHDRSEGWPLGKSHAMVPELFRIAMTYGQLPFTDRTCTQWITRNVLRWCKPNPSVGAEGDKFRRATTEFVVATLSPDRYWDPMGARGPARQGAGTAPLYDWWDLPTGNFTGAHFATYPLELVSPLITSMCPHKVCRTCGKPAMRITRTSDDYAESRDQGDMFARVTGENDRGSGRNGASTNPSRSGAAEYEHIGWTWCGHDGDAHSYQLANRKDWTAAGKPRWPTVWIGGAKIGWLGPDSWIKGGDPDSGRRGVVLDPFAGSGTTLAAANGLGRDAIGVELLDTHAELAVDRIGPMFLEIVQGDAHLATT